MKLFKWFNLTLTLFCLTILVGFTSGIKCWTCENNGITKVDTCNGGNGLLKDYGNGYACVYVFVTKTKEIGGRGAMAKDNREFGGIGCAPYNEGGTRCTCDETDGCNAGMPNAGFIFGLNRIMLIGLAGCIYLSPTFNLNDQ